MTDLDDNIYGELDLDDVGNHTWTTSTCDLGAVLDRPTTVPPAARMSTSARSRPFHRQLPAMSQTDTVTGAVTDDDDNAATDNDDALVSITGVAPTVVVTKTADPTHA